MSKRHKHGLKKQNTKVSYGVPINYVIDNPHPEIVAQLRDQNRTANFITKKVLGLKDDADDHSLVSAASDAATAQSFTFMVSKDRGKGDKQMPRIVNEFENMGTITYSATINKEDALSIFSLVTRSRYKKILKKPAKNIDLAKNGDTVVLKITSTSGRTRTKLIKQKLHKQ
ncbi:MAG: hypothetical protein WDN66_02610 [Candidatus Saccharibacteria bacterium]